MKKTYLIVTIIGAVMIIASCGNSSNSDFGYAPNDEWYSPEFGDNDYLNGQQTEYVRCPLCNGTGIVYMVPGDYMSQQTCEACNGAGQCDENIAKQIQQMYDDIITMTSGGYNNVYGYYDGKTQSSNQIEAEIARLEANITQMESSLEYLDGISKIQLEQQIINEKYEIRRLKIMQGDF